MTIHHRDEVDGVASISDVKNHQFSSFLSSFPCAASFVIFLRVTPEGLARNDSTFEMTGINWNLEEESRSRLGTLQTSIKFGPRRCSIIAILSTRSLKIPFSILVFSFHVFIIHTSTWPDRCGQLSFEQRLKWWKKIVAVAFVCGAMENY